LLAAAFLMVVATSWSQRTSNWRIYRMADGLPESACVAITISPQGKVLAKHLNDRSVSELDGYTVNVIPTPEILASRVYESPGGQLWTVVPGGLQEYKNDAWVFHPVPQIATNFPPGRLGAHVSLPLLPTRQGRVLFLLPDRLMEFNSEDVEHPAVEVIRTANQTAINQLSATQASYQNRIQELEALDKKLRQLTR